MTNDGFNNGYFRYFRGRGVSAGSMREEILGSDYYTIPRAKLRKRDVSAIYF